MKTLASRRFFASVAFFSVGFVASLPAGPLIPVKTRVASLVFSTDANNHLTQYYVGPVSGTPVTYDSANDQDNVVYPTADSVFYSQPALRATHFDGNTSTDLVYVQHSTQDVGSGVTLTKIQLKDSYYPFFADLFVRSYPSDNVFEEWTEVHHQEPAAVTLYEVASAGLAVNATSCWLTHYHRDRGNRLIASETKLTPLIELLKSVGGATASRATEPVFVVSLGGSAQSNQGAAVAGILLTAGDFVNSFDYEEPDNIFPYNPMPVITRLRILGSNDPRLLPSRFPPNQTLVTPPMVFTYHDQGVKAATARLRAWGQAHLGEASAGVRSLVGLPTED